MLEYLLSSEKVYLACGFTDLRKSVDGLSAIVSQQFKLDPFSDAVFLFCNKQRDKLKVLIWDSNGFVLLYKRLEEGKFQWPRTAAEARLISHQELRWLLEGLSIEQPKALGKVFASSLC